ncbi:unnamed protein product, partial [Meganyctiphanes norvegica]
QECRCLNGNVDCYDDTTKCAESCEHGVPIPGNCCTDCSQCLAGETIVNNGSWIALHGGKCQECQCVSGSLQCRPQQQCPQLHCLNVFQPHNSCCPKCQGCTDDVSQNHEAGETWTNLNDPCIECQCNEGHATCNRKECPVPCSHPVPPSPTSCCPTCDGCLYDSKVYLNAQEVLHQDPCQTCNCNKGGVICETVMCPEVYCTKAFIPDGKCCPECYDCLYNGQSF